MDNLFIQMEKFGLHPTKMDIMVEFGRCMIASLVLGGVRLVG